jgi:uncharacterized protein (DUF1499 family)
MFGARRHRPVKFNKSIDMDQESLLANSANPSLTARSSRNEVKPIPAYFWVFLGSLYILLGVMQLILAAIWKWWFGVAIGFGIGKLGTSLLGLGATSAPPQQPPPGASSFAHLKHAAWLAITSGSSKIQRLFWIFRWPIYGYGVFALLLIIVHMSSPDPKFRSFPDSCPKTHWFGCSRVAELNSHGSRGLELLHIPAKLPDVQQIVEKWIYSQSGSPRILRSTRTGFIHVRFLSMLFGFADDMLINLRCDEDGNTIIELQGQLRIGKGDLGVNRRRNKRLLTGVGELAKSLPEGECTPRPKPKPSLPPPPSPPPLPPSPPPPQKD